MGRRLKKIYVEISNVCNLQCSFCPEVERPKRFMDADFLRKILIQAAPLCDEVSFHVMGEPLAHPDLPLFLDIARETGLPVNLTTNGTLATKWEDTLLHKGLRQLNFSLQSYSDNFPEKPLTDYLDRIFRVARRALKERPDLYLNYRLWNIADGETTDARNEALLALIEQEYGVELSRNLNLPLGKGKRLKGLHYIHYDSRFRWPSPKDPERATKGTCYGLRHQLAVHADGAVVPCCLDKEAAIKLGSISESSLTEVLDSPLAKKIRSGFERGELVHPLCRRCDYARRFDRKAARAGG